jgi:hypothetical protein
MTEPFELIVDWGARRRNIPCATLEEAREEFAREICLGDYLREDMRPRCGWVMLCATGDRIASFDYDGSLRLHGEGYRPSSGPVNGAGGKWLAAQHRCEWPDPEANRHG